MALVVEVAHGQEQTLPAELEGTEAQLSGAQPQVHHRHAASGHQTDGRGYSGPHYAPLEGKNENPVQHQVDDGRNQAAAHGQFGRTVQPDDEQGYGNPDLKGPRRHKPLQVVNGQGNQIVGGSEQPYRRFRKIVITAVGMAVMRVANKRACVTLSCATLHLPRERWMDATTEHPTPIISPMPVYSI